MPTPLIVNGQTFNYPNTNDTAWGYEATGWAVAVTAGLIPKAGGAFTLTGPVNFGSIAGLLAKSFSSNTGSNVATSGILNLTATDVVAWRNTSNTGDNVLGVNGSNQITFNGVAISGNQLTTKGDLLGYSSQPVRVPVGPYLSVLTSDYTQGDGISYSALAVGSGLSLNYTSNTFTFANTGVLSFSFNDNSTTPIYTVTPTATSTGAIAATMTLVAQTHNTMLAGPASGTGTAQPTFRHLVAADLEGTAPGAATEVIYNGTVGGVPNSFDADTGLTYQYNVSSNTILTIGDNSGSGAILQLSNPASFVYGQSFAVGTNAGGSLVVQAGSTAYNGAAGGTLELAGGNGGGSPNPANIVLQGCQADGSAGYANIYGGQSYASIPYPTPAAGNILIKAGDAHLYSTPTNALAGNVYIQGGTRYNVSNVAQLDQYNGSILFYTSGASRLFIGPLGDWSLGSSPTAGSAGQVLTSLGTGLPPQWTNVNDFPSYTIAVGNTSTPISLASSATAITSWVTGPTGTTDAFIVGSTYEITIHGTCTSAGSGYVEFQVQMGSTGVLWATPQFTTVNSSSTAINYVCKIYLVYKGFVASPPGGPNNQYWFMGWCQVNNDASVGIIGRSSLVSPIQDDYAAAQQTGPATISLAGLTTATTCTVDYASFKAI